MDTIPCSSEQPQRESAVMRIRTHLGRPFDLSLMSNRLAVGITLAAGLGGLVVWRLTGDGDALWAPVHAGLAWALVREIDPDHDWSAIVSCVLAATWVLIGFTSMSVLAVGGIILACRLVLNSTGRRPLVTDLAAMAAFATIISFSAVGWVGGFGLAVAVYIDERLAEEHNTTALVAAVLGAVGASGVATLANAFPRELPEIRPPVVVAVGVLALIAVVREPEAPISMVDSRKKSFMEPARLHGARGLFGVLVFLLSIVASIDSVGVEPLAIILALVLASNELERIRRRSQVA